MAHRKCGQITGAKSQEMTVICVADPGDFSATPEAAYYLSNLKQSKPVPKSVSSASVCFGRLVRIRASV